MARRRYDPSELVDEFHARIYDYIQRLVGDTQAAMDLTQDVFAETFRRFDRIRGENWSAWLYRVATHRVYNYTRDIKRRQAKKRELAMAAEPASTVDLVEQRELREVIEAKLQELSLEDRSLIYLHYFHGLSQRQLATVLTVPRTTIASRLVKARADLEAKLRPLAQTVTGVGDATALLASSPPLTPPAELGARLTELAASSGTLSSTSNAILGSLLMTKKALLIASVCCGCCGLAFWGGWSAGALGSAHSEDDRDLRTKIAAVEGELETSRTATERLASERDHIASQLATAEQTKRELLRRVQAMNETARSENAHAVANASHADAAGVLYGVNWPELQALTLEHRGVALAVGDLIAGGSGSRSLSPEMLAARQKIVSALSNAATQLRLEVPYPALDPDVLPRMLDVYFGGLVGLSEEQLDEIKRVAASYQSEFDDDPRTPIIAQRRRERLLTRLGQALEGRLDETQHSDWQRLAPIWEEIRSGRVRRVQLGVADEAKARDRLLHEWRDYYRLEAENRDAATRLATRYVSEARELLANWGQNGAEPRTLTADERARFGHAIADLQDRIDRELLKGLSDVQLDLLQGRYALDIHIDDSARCQVSTAETPGF